MSQLVDMEVLDAAIGVQATMADGYTGTQAVQMCVTARNNPGVPVAYDAESGGRCQVVYIEGLGWAVEQA